MSKIIQVQISIVPIVPIHCHVNLLEFLMVNLKRQSDIGNVGVVFCMSAISRHKISATRPNHLDFIPKRCSIFLCQNLNGVFLNLLTVRDFENKVDSGNINMKSPAVSCDKSTTSLSSKVKMLKC